MRPDRNHEGYHDPTAGKAIRRAKGSRKRTRKIHHLTYKLCEVRGFPNSERCRMTFGSKTKRMPGALQ